MGEVLVTGFAPFALVAIVLGFLRARRRRAFGVTVRRAHPELAAAGEIDSGRVGAVAARAIDVRTPAARRAIAADLEVV